MATKIIQATVRRTVQPKRARLKTRREEGGSEYGYGSSTRGKEEEISLRPNPLKSCSLDPCERKWSKRSVRVKIHIAYGLGLAVVNERRVDSLDRPKTDDAAPGENNVAEAGITNYGKCIGFDG